MTLFVRKWVLKPFLILMLWVVGLLGTGIGLLLLTQERIVKLGVNELNKQIDGELVVGTSKISIFKHFPSVGDSLRQEHALRPIAKSAVADARILGC